MIVQRKTKRINLSKNKTIIFIVILFLVFSILCLLLARSFNIKSLFGDDLTLYIEFKNQNFFEYVFKPTSIYFRPLFYFVSYIVFSICQINHIAITYICAVFHIITTIILFIVLLKISKKTLLSFVLSLIFMFSRYSFYNITMIHGIMESICYILIIYFFYNIYIYLYSKNDGYRRIIIINVLMLLTMMTHERFFVLIFPLIGAILFKYFNKKKSLFINLLISVLIFLFFVILKVAILKKPFIVNTNVGEKFSFDFLKSLKQLCISIADICGLPLLENYVVGIQFNNLNIIVKILCCLIFILNVLLLLFILYKVIKFIYENKRMNVEASLFFVILIFIGVEVASMMFPSVVLPRFLYPPFFAVLFLVNIGFGKFQLFNFKKENNIFKAKVYCYFTFSLIAIVNVCFIFCISPNFIIIDDNIWAENYRNNIVLKYENEIKNKKIVMFLENEKNKNKINDYLYQFTNSRDIDFKDFNTKEEYMDTITKEVYEKEIIFSVSLTDNINRLTKQF